MFLPVSVCLPVRLSARLYSTSYERILIKIFEGVGRGARNNRLDLDDDPAHDLRPEFMDRDKIQCRKFLKDLFIWYCDFYRQPRKKT